MSTRIENHKTVTTENNATTPFNAMLEQAIALGAVKGYVLAVDSTAFKAYSARDYTNRRGKSDSDADVGRAGRAYVLGYRVHLACAEGDVPVAFTVQPISRNDKPFLQAPTGKGLECWSQV